MPPCIPKRRELLPDINAGAAEASPLRQLNWLWQMWELWDVLVAHGVGASLLSTPNVRVEGWRLRLLELLPHQQPPTLASLIRFWQALLGHLHPSVTDRLGHLLDDLNAG